MRSDLLALTDDSLAALANRGIVKRSARDVADGKGPSLREDGDTVTATFDDGTMVVLVHDATIEQSQCTCVASGLCRHRVMLAIAYRDVAAVTAAATLNDEDPYAADASDPTWVPGAFTDEEVEAHIGSRAMGVARKARADDPLPS